MTGALPEDIIVWNRVSVFHDKNTVVELNRPGG